MLGSELPVFSATLAGIVALRSVGRTSYQLPVTFYQLPSDPIGIELAEKDLFDFSRTKTGGLKSVGDGMQPSLIDSICYPIKDGIGAPASIPYPPNLLARQISEKRLDSPLGSGYICIMRDRNREKDSMVHVRFTEDERRQLKAHCALLGMSMQEYIRAATLKGLARKKGGRKQ